MLQHLFVPALMLFLKNHPLSHPAPVQKPWADRYYYSDATIDPGWADIRAESIGAYLSFESGTAEARIDDAFPPATLARLRGIKGR